MEKECKAHVLFIILQNIALYTVREVEFYGRDHQITPHRSTKEEWGTLSFTSGTTGYPKGVILSQNHFVSDITGCYDAGIRGRTTDVYLSFLPMAHTLERVMQHAIFIDGGCIYFYSGDTKLISKDLIKVRPTVLTAVPRLLNKIYDIIQMKMLQQSGLVKTLFKQACDTKLEYLKQGYLEHKLWDALVFNAV